VDWKYNLTSFEGRLNRKPYWLTAIAIGIVFTILFYIILGLFGSITPSTDPTVPAAMNFSPIGWVLMIILYVVFLYASVALAVKRLHDRNRSGWFYLLMLVPLVNIWIAIEILFLRGTSGSNRFGEDPLAGQ
jgi:uncharacterized membrane protein YhaH (DUF805 family)